MAKNDNEKAERTIVESIEVYKIEDLKKETGITESVFEGIKVAKGWAEGKEVTKKEFEMAVETWLNSPINGKEVK